MIGRLILVAALVAGPELAKASYQGVMGLLGAGPTAMVGAQGAPADATYLTQTPHGSLSSAQALSGLSDGLLRHSSGVVARAVPGTDYDPEVTYRLTADQSNSTTAFGDVSGWTWPMAAGQVLIWTCQASYTTAASTTAIQLSVNGPASPTALRYAVTLSTSTTARHQSTQSAYDTVANAGTGHNTGGVVQMWGTVENGANAGTFAVRLRSEIAASAVTLLRGGTCRVVAG